jgi:hypothetical protein
MLEQVSGINDGIDLLLKRYIGFHGFPLEQRWWTVGVSSRNNGGKSNFDRVASSSFVCPLIAEIQEE